MTDVVERTVGGLTVRIDRLLCVGFGDCVTEAPETFALDGESVAEFLDDAGSAGDERVLAACRACPVDALVALDPEGRQVAP